MGEHYDCNTPVLGPAPTYLKDVRVLNKIMTWQNETNHGMNSYEVDPGHAGIFMIEFGVDGGKPVVSIVVKCDATNVCCGHGGGRRGARRFVRCSFDEVSIVDGHLSSAPPGVQYACKELRSATSNPTIESRNHLKRPGEHLRGSPRLAHRGWRIDRCNALNAYIDANLAHTKKPGGGGGGSTSGGAIMLGPHWTKAWSNTQRFIASPSAGFELYASVGATAEAFGLQSMTKDMPIDVQARIPVDGPAALEIVSRRGICNIRHLDANRPWAQGMAAIKRMNFEKVNGANNVADLMTKYIPKAEIGTHVGALGICCPGGRVDGAPRIAIGEGGVASVAPTDGQRHRPPADSSSYPGGGHCQSCGLSWQCAGPQCEE